MPWEEDGSRKKSTLYKKSGFKMKGWSPFTQKQDKKELTEKQKKDKEKLEETITKEHNITEEKFNPTGNTCLICGNKKDDHKNKDHAFRGYLMGQF